ncbi:uncharacterized protein LOC134271108 [Saccostrea cucullata]|uniref:uncharacterized protein LOC134271108 n=1 Tax=Saccostrea cuccullata TaxID=36930 RepID=UPI002ED1D77A
MTGVVSLLAVSLTITVVMNVIDAQVCSGTVKCLTDYGRAGKSLLDKEKQCKAARDYLTCLETAAEGCGGDTDSIVKPAKDALSAGGCSGSGAPVLSFLTIVLGVVLSRYF